MSQDNSLRGPSIAVLPPPSQQTSIVMVTPSVDAETLPTFAQGVGLANLEVLIEGKPALIGYDHEFLFVARGHSPSVLANPAKAYLRVPLALLLHASFVADSDGGSLLVRLLSPPLQNQSGLAQSSVAFFSKPKSSPKCFESLDAETFKALSNKQRAERLRTQLDGPCKNLRLFKIEARVVTLKDGEDVESKVDRWVSEVMERAYRDVQPYRRIKALINPFGGPGKARQLFETRVKPILEAAGCKLDVSFTTHRMHGLEIAKELDLDSFDALTTVSGDGLIHEVLNGFASRADFKKALTLPIAPIPTGSGNAMAINLLGVEQGFSLALACLNLIKGKPMKLDLLAITQPASAFPPGSFMSSKEAKVKPTEDDESRQVTGNGRNSDDASLITETPSKPYLQYYSFLSQAIGIMADLDLGTEHLRALGDTRFMIGFAQSVLRNAACEVDVDVKLGLRGSKNKAEIRAQVAKFIEKGSWGESSTRADDMDPETHLGAANGLDSATETSQEEAWRKDAFGEERYARNVEHCLRHGAVTDPLEGEGDAACLPPFDLVDPSWPDTLAKKLRKPEADVKRHSGAASSVLSSSASASGFQQSENGDQSLGWYRVQERIASLHGGKVPYVARDLMQFPFALPGDGTIDLALLLHGGGRLSKLPETGWAESGKTVYQKSCAYIKVEAYRVTPRLEEGDKRLKKGGLISIDGEKVPFAPFQVEVAHGKKYSVLSLYGQFCVAAVEPPKAK